MFLETFQCLSDKLRDADKHTLYLYIYKYKIPMQVQVTKHFSVLVEYYILQGRYDIAINIKIEK